MKNTIKKTLAAILSASMILSSFAALADDNINTGKVTENNNISIEDTAFENDNILSIKENNNVSIPFEIINENLPYSFQEKVDLNAGVGLVYGTVYSGPTRDTVGLAGSGNSVIEAMFYQKVNSSDEYGEYIDIYSGSGDEKGIIPAQTHLYNYSQATTERIYNKITALMSSATQQIPLTIHEGITAIGQSAFGRCTKGFSDVSLPDSLITIGPWAFTNSSIGDGTATLTIPKNVQVIDTNAFRMSNLARINVPEATYRIGEYAFLDDKDIYIDNWEGSITGAPWGATGTVYWRERLEVSDISDQYFYGNAVEPSVTVKKIHNTTGATTTLTEGTDYTVTYYNNRAVGTGTAKVVFTGDYKNASPIEKTFNIVSPSIEIDDIPDQIYYAVPLSPEVSVYDTTSTRTLLTEGTDYTVSYSNNNRVGTGNANISFLGKYAAKTSITANFNIINPNLEIEDVPDQLFVGKNVEPKITIYNLTDGTTLNDGVDYTVEYDLNDAVGTGYAYITYINHYAGYTGDATYISFNILEWDISLVPDDSIDISANDGSIKISVNDAYFNPIGDGDNDTGLEGVLPGGCYYDSSLYREVGGVYVEYITPTGAVYPLIEGVDFYNEGCYVNNSTGIGSVGIVGIGKFIGVANAGYTVHPYDLSLLCQDIDMSHIYINDYCLDESSGNWFEQFDTTYTGNPVCPFGEDIDDLSFESYDSMGIPTYSSIWNEDVATGKWRMNAYYENNINAGLASVVIEGLGPCFTGTLRFNYYIEPMSLWNYVYGDVYKKGTTIVMSRDDLMFRGEPIEPSFEIEPSDYSLNYPIPVEGIDYYLEYHNNDKPSSETDDGYAYGVAVGIGNFKHTVGSMEFVIGDPNPRADGEFDLEQAIISISDEYTYDGSEKQPKPIVNYEYVFKDTGYKFPMILEENVDYTLSYENNINAGVANVVLNPIGVSKNSKTEDFDIAMANLTDITAQNISDQFYSGGNIEPELSLSFNGMTLIKDTDYEVTFENNTNLGTATAIIQGVGNYTGEITKDFNIIAALFSEDTITIEEIPDETYNRKAHTPEPIVKMGDNVLEKDVDFEYSYDNNVNAGTANITITGKGNYEGTVDITFKINPRNGALFTYYLIFFDDEDE